MRKGYLLPVFLLCFCFVVFIMLLAGRGILSFATNSMQMTLFPVGTLITQLHFTSSKKISEIDLLKEENAHLVTLLAQKMQLEQDNAALRDQFDTAALSSKILLPVQVVGMPRVIPNVSFPETLIIHAGKKERVGIGSVVVVKDEVVGIATDANDHYANVALITNKQSSFSVKTSKGAIGVAKGQGDGEVVVDNILLSDSLSIGDSVMTLGNQDLSATGYPPSLIVGKIVSVEKNPSSLFQKARVVPLIPFDRLQVVFVIRK